MTSRDSWFGRFRGTHARHARGVRGLLCVFAAIAAVLALAAPAALAGGEFTWTGLAPGGRDWSLPANWEGEPVLGAPATIGTLNFPGLTSNVCTKKTFKEPLSPCYSTNDLSGLSVEEIRIDDSENYLIGGEELSLSRGLTSAPEEGTAGAGDDIIELPLDLTASQEWNLSARVSEAGENSLSLGSSVTGSTSALAVKMSGMAGLSFAENDTEVGPVSFEGKSQGVAGVDNGFAALLEGKLNATDRNNVEVSHILFFGSGRVGPLITSGAELGVGMPRYPAERMEAASVSLDPASQVVFHVTGNGTTAGNDFSQLVSAGPVSLAGSDLVVEVSPPKKEEACPVLVPGETFTFITTPEPLSGEFSDALGHGAELPVRFSSKCGAHSQTIRISYHESGGTETVTGTVEAAAKEAQEAREHQEAKERQEAKEHQEAKERQEAAERQLPAAPPTSVSVGGTTEPAPVAVFASKVFTVSPAGRFTVRVKCSAGAARCTGLVDLSTLHAVAAARGVPSRTAHILTLATGYFNLAPGQEGSVTLYLASAGRRLLARSHSLSARGAIKLHRAAGGYMVSQAAVVTLRASHPKHA